MKSKDETLDMSMRWYAEISDTREQYPLIMVVRDNSGANTSKELNDFFTNHGVKKYFSMSRVRSGIRNNVGKDRNDRVLTWRKALVLCHS